MSDSQAFASALERAKQINSKITDPSTFPANSQAGMKRSAQSYDSTYQSTEKRPFINDKSASAAAAEAVARLNQKLGVPQQQTTQSMPLQAQPYPAQYPNGSNNMPGATAQTASVIIQIPDHLVGLIIGKRGEQITSLQAESSCKVQITQEKTGPERPITLTGTPQQIEHARRLINDLITRAERGVNSNPMMQHAGSGDNFFQVELSIPGNKAGLVIGKGGETIKSLQEEHGVKMVLIQQTNQASLEDKPLRISGDRARVERVQQIVMDLLNAKAGSSGPMMPTAGAGQDFQRFAVPAEKAGLVIGKGGETIKEIIKQSNCHVEISKDPPPSASLKLFNIRGTPEDINKAKKLISDRAGIPLSNNEPYGGATSGYNVYASYMQDASQAANGAGNMPGPTINPYTGMPDYSAAWIEYYRRIGMPEQAEKIALQAQQQGMAAAQGATAVGAGQQVAAAYAAQPSSAAPSMVAAGPGAQQAGNVDYSQWQAWQQWQAYQQQQGQAGATQAWSAAAAQGVAQAGNGQGN